MINKIFRNNKLASFSSPRIIIYFVSNDKFFSNYFLKNFSIEYPFKLIEHNHCDLFIEEIHQEKTNKHKIPFVIIDHMFDNQDSLENKLGIDLANEIIKTHTTWDIILLTPPNCIHKPLPQNITSVIRNDNAFQRIQNIILTISNEKSIILQKKSNIITFIILTSCIATIISFLAYFIFFNL